MGDTMKGKVAVISGVASGFGKATAELFASKDQCSLVLIDFNEAGLNETAENCKKSGSEVLTICGDVTKDGFFEDVAAQTKSKFGKCDALINYAGGAVQLEPIESMTNEIYTKVMDLNLKSTLMSCRSFTPMMKAQGYGRIVNVSSVCDRRSWPTWSVYSAAKAAVNAFSKCLYTELRPEGIGVTLLVPGGSNTGFQNAKNVDKFEWDEAMAVRPEHFADMVYQACQLTQGACVSEMHVYGLAQDISGF
ncbi:MAG: SDR family NAD(P)-dependent oxidoreductase [Spirochaetales bacterium]|uniref:SDR family NAD(P)-dependent oxidoreductase n=1 Tax=Candidatus Thalassospirochaeta sargassi TaxID=3119039 RepID=A0AAJ1IBS1_9SPIO|nr:SDR family NAD(P)-dependent oxidoreductase [Spirochaetales bacterium]